MSKYKLYYFDLPGRAEIIRVLFHYGRLKFEDYRIDFDQWPAMKTDTPFGQVPVMEINDAKYCQSIAIARYIANEVNLGGNNNIENLLIDCIVNTIGDFFEKVIQYAFVETNDIKRKVLYDELIKTTAPFFIERLELYAKANKGYLAAERLTWADIFFVVILENTTNYLFHHMLGNSPNLQQVKKNVLSLATIREYVQNRQPNMLRKFYDLKNEL